MVRVRWMIRADISAVLAIEHASGARSWGALDLLRGFREPEAVGVVAEREGCVVGFMLYVPRGRALHVLRLVVAPAERRRGVGRQMISRLVARLDPARRTRVVVEVGEAQLDAQLFLRACGFRAVAITRGADVGSEEDVYVFHREWVPEPRSCRVSASHGQDQTCR